MLSFEQIEKNLQKENPREDIVRVKTDTWVNGRNELIIQKTVRQMRSLSKSPNGYLAFEEELSMMGTDAIGTSFIGLENLEDGLYEMVVHHMSRGIETGYVDDVEFKFVPVDTKELQ